MICVCVWFHFIQGGRGGAAQHDTAFPNPLWHQTLTRKIHLPPGQTPVKKGPEKMRTVAELVLFFMPKVGEEPGEDDTRFWQVAILSSQP